MAVLPLFVIVSLDYSQDSGKGREMFALLLLIALVAAGLWYFAKRRPEEFSSRSAEMKGRAEVEWRRVQERGNENYEDLKAEFLEEQELHRRAAVDAATAGARDRPL
jgi:hypothetical protein